MQTPPGPTATCCRPSTGAAGPTASWNARATRWGSSSGISARAGALTRSGTTPSCSGRAYRGLLDDILPIFRAPRVPVPTRRSEHLRAHLARRARARPLHAWNAGPSRLRINSFSLRFSSRHTVPRRAELGARHRLGDRVGVSAHRKTRRALALHETRTVLRPASRMHHPSRAHRDRHEEFAATCSPSAAPASAGGRFVLTQSAWFRPAQLERGGVVARLYLVGAGTGQRSGAGLPASLLRPVSSDS
jgi:hypothetical protein